MNKQLAMAVTSLLLAPLAGGVVHAQTASTASASNEAIGLEEIVITAQRREESSQRAAIAISTVGGDAIDEANITRPGGLQSIVPSLQVSDNTGPYSTFYVRGVGNFANNALSDSALLFNFDGVTVARSGTSGFFYDLERVEVLKGPQGILYGRNATGGAINVVSKKPMLGEFGGDASLQLGNYSALRVDAALNAPLGDTAAMRFAGFHVKHDGYMSDGTDDQDDTGGRVSLLMKPSESLDISLVADFFRQGGQAAGGTVIGVTSSFSASPTFSPSDRLGFFSPQVASYIPTQINAVSQRPFVPFQNVNHEDNRFWGVAATFDWTTPIGTLTAIPAFRDSKLDYTSFATGVMLREQSHDKQSTFELRLTSPTDQALRYVVGGFYLHDPNNVPRFDVNQQAVATFQSYVAKTDSYAGFGSLTWAVTDAFRLTGGARYTHDKKTFDGSTSANTHLCGSSYAFPGCMNTALNQPFPYTQMGPVPAHICDFFTFTTGCPDTGGTDTLLNVIPNNNSQAYSKTTWKLGADWDLTDHNFLYASAETGFKSGGFFFSADNNIYKPETLRAFTVGSKNRFLDNRLQANLELFYWKYHDQQISHLSQDSKHDTIFPTENVGLATIKGAELDLQARPLRNTTLSLDVQYNNAVYDRFVYNTPNQNFGRGNGTGCPNLSITSTLYTVDCSGEQPPNAPRWTVAGGVQQTIPLPGDAKLVGNARGHYQSKTLTAFEFLPVEEQPGYTMWDFDLTYYTKDDKVFVGAYVNNAFDKTALSFTFITPQSNMATATLQHPRTTGVRAGFKF